MTHPLLRATVLVAALATTAAGTGCNDDELPEVASAQQATKVLQSGGAEAVQCGRRLARSWACQATIDGRRFGCSVYRYPDSRDEIKSYFCEPPERQRQQD